MVTGSRSLGTAAITAHQMLHDPRMNALLAQQQQPHAHCDAAAPAPVPSPPDAPTGPESPAAAAVGAWPPADRPPSHPPHASHCSSRPARAGTAPAHRWAAASAGLRAAGHSAGGAAPQRSIHKFGRQTRGCDPAHPNGICHTTWFFDTFVLQPHAAASSLRPALEPTPITTAVGSVTPGRSCSAAPAIGAVLAWRQRVDAGLEHCCRTRPDWCSSSTSNHQELLLMDLPSSAKQPATTGHPGGAQSNGWPAPALGAPGRGVPLRQRNAAAPGVAGAV